MSEKTSSHKNSWNLLILNLACIRGVALPSSLTKKAMVTAPSDALSDMDHVVTKFKLNPMIVLDYYTKPEIDLLYLATGITHIHTMGQEGID